MKRKYFNVTISGLPGSGSTTLLNGLKEVLQFDGWKGFSGGEFMRSYALEKGIFKENEGLHHSATDYEDDFDRKIDMGMREKLQTEKQWIIESWLSGFLAQGVEGTLKVLMTCSDEAIKIDRVVNRDRITVIDAKTNMRDRYEANLNKWARMYAKEWQEWVVKPGTLPATAEIDFWDPKLYDVVIDTYSQNQEAVLQTVLGVLQGSAHDGQTGRQS